MNSIFTVINICRTLPRDVAMVIRLPADEIIFRAGYRAILATSYLLKTEMLPQSLHDNSS